MHVRLSNSASFWLIAYTLVVVMMGTNIPAPLYSVYGHLWHFSTGMATLLFAVYAFVLVPSSLVFGQLSDRVGRRKMLLLGVVLAVIASVVFAAAHATWMVLLSRAIQGLCVGVLSGTAIAALAELRADRGQGTSLIASVAIAIGTATGPLFAGLLAQYAPFPIRLPYAVHLVLLTPAFIGVLLTPETVQRALKPSRLHVPYVPVAIRSRFLIASFVATAAWAVAGFFMVVAPSFVIALIGIHNLAVAGAVVFLMLGASTVAQIASRKLSATSAIGLGFALLGLGIVGVVISIPAHLLWLLLISTIVAGAGHGPAAAGSLVLVTAIAPANSRADVVSSYYAIAYLGVSVPVLGLGILAQWIGTFDSIVVFSLVILCALGAMARFVGIANRCDTLEDTKSACTKDVV